MAGSLLKRNSLRIVKIRHFDLEYNIFGWLQTLLNLSVPGENIL